MNVSKTTEIRVIRWYMALEKPLLTDDDCIAVLKNCDDICEKVNTVRDFIKEARSEIYERNQTK